MKKIDVLIVYEHVSRELESALLLQQRLENAGLTVEVTQVGWNEDVARLIYNPKIIVVPWCYDDVNYEYFRGYVGGYKDGKFKIVNIHCEQITTPEQEDCMIPKGNARDVYHFIWGEYFNQRLMQAGIDAKTVYITGNPRLDFFREDFKYVSRSKEELAEKFALPTTKKWAMVIGSFSGSEDNENKIMPSIVEHYEHILEWLESACKNPEISEHYELIYRPHPSEPITKAVALLEKKYDNFHVTKDYAIRDWMVNCDILFHWNSTSAVEAVHAQKPLYTLRPLETTSMLFLDKIEKIETKEAFENCLIQELRHENKDVNAEFKKELAYIYNQEQTPTVDRMTGAILEIIQNDDFLIEGNAKLANQLWKAFKHYIRRLAKAVGILHKISRFSVSYLDTLTPKEYQEYKNRVQKRNEA